jgi:tetratricopeptide (TPR) repeat protein
MKTISLIAFVLLTAASTFAEDDYFDLVRQAQAKNEAKAWPEAAKLWQRVVALNPVRSSLWNALAEAHFEAKEYRQAIAAWEKALELGFWPAHTALHIGRAWARMGEHQKAVQSVRRALDLRFPALGQIQEHPDLKVLHDDPAFRDLVGLPPRTPMTRQEGWRRDLRLIRREIERKGFQPYRRLTREQFDARFAALEKNVPRLADIDVIVEIMRLLREVDDGHTGIIPRERPEFATALPVLFYLFREGVFVIAADPSQRELLGAEVLQVGKRPVAEAVAALEPLIPRDNPHGVLERIPFQMRHPVLMKALGFDATQLTLRFPDRSVREVKIAADASAPNIWQNLPENWVRLSDTLGTPVPLYLKNRRLPYWFEYLPDEKLLFFQWNSVRSAREERFDAFVERLMTFIRENPVEKLVVDLRWNNGGNTVIGKTFVDALEKEAKVNVRGKLFVIIGRRTYSAAQNVATMLETETNTIFVGEQSGSSPNFVGEEDFVKLPYSGIPMNVSDFYWQSAWPWDRRLWLAPELYAPPTFAAFAGNRDVAMEAVRGHRP